MNAKGLDNDTPLHDAAANGHFKLVKLLVEKGADIYAKNSKGKTPLDTAAPDVAPFLLNPNLPIPGRIFLFYSHCGHFLIGQKCRSLVEYSTRGFQPFAKQIELRTSFLAKIT